MTAAPGAEPGSGTVLLRAGLVRTGDPALPTAEAVLLRQGVILEVGMTETLLALVDASAQVIDVRPWTILPGLTDGHCHLAQMGVLASAADLRSAVAPDVDALLHALAVTRPDPTGWVVGHGYTEYGLREGRAPNRQELDRAVPDAPAVVFHTSLHTCVVNTPALRVLGIDDGAPDPTGGRLGRTLDGQLDGRLIEGPMFDLFAGMIARRLELDGRGLVAAATRHLASFGITTCVDANTTAAEWAALTAAAVFGDLPVRVATLLRYEDAASILAAGPAGTNSRLEVLGAKVFADGGMSSRTAAVEPGYATPAGERGMLLLDTAALVERVRGCGELGIGVGVHAQGERAIAATLDAVAAVGADVPAVRRLEHAGAFTPPLRARARDLGMAVATQPAFLSALGDGFLEAFGSARSAYLYPLRSMVETGIPVTGSSDAPVVTASPWLAMRDAILRRTSSGATIGVDERLDAFAALGLYVGAPSPIPSLRARAGRLATGAPADLVIIDRDPLAVTAEDLPATRVVATMVGGVVTHGALARA